MSPRASGTAAFFVAWLAVVAAVGCAHPGSIGAPGPTPTPSGLPSPTSSPTFNCTITTQDATADLVVMASTVTATTDPTYGLINGYTDQPDPVSGGPANVASVIRLAATQKVQFANADIGGPLVIDHSAVGFPGATAFPSTPFTFPQNADQPIGTAISSALWSTGRLPSSPDFGFTICFSQTFTLTAGVYFFGDFDYYNPTNSRGVIVVSTTSAAAHRRIRLPLKRVR